MKKLINNPSDFVDESLEGILLAHADCLRSLEEDSRVIIRNDVPQRGKVAIATGGGYGHLPVFLGYVGKGLADGVCVGNVFSSPSADSMLEVTKAIDGGAGVLYLYGNYFGDKMNFDLAQELSAEAGIRVETLRVSDDVASSPPEDWKKRRGVAGLFFVYKIAGACAELGGSLDEVKRAAEIAIQNVRTIGIGFSPCIVPASGQPTFSLSENEMEIGIGIHGEPGIVRTEMKPAHEAVYELLGRLKHDLGMSPGDEISVLVNGLGATPLEELYIAYREVHQWSKENDVHIYRPYVGRLATSLEMAGFSLSILKLNDELKDYLDAPAYSPFFQQS